MRYSKIIVAAAMIWMQLPTTAQLKPTHTAPAPLPLPSVPADYDNGLLINYVRTWEARRATNDASPTALADNALYKTATAYFDGLGRPLQTVVKGNNFDGTKDLVSLHQYDALGREPQQYLPYAPATGNNGKFRPQAFAEQQAYYNNVYQDQTPFSKTDFEASPLNRPVKTYPPGNSWAGSGVGVTMQQGLNTLNEDVKMTSIVNGQPVFGNAYPTGRLYKTTVTDEAGHQTVEYKDDAGRVLLKKVQEAATPGSSYTGWLATYYVYDEFDRLAFVAPPKAVERLIVDGWQLIGNTGTELCYTYLYDARGRLVSKQLPGAAPILMCYDRRDRLVYVQDGNQRSPSGTMGPQWLVTFYDELNRPTGTALYATTQTQQQLQASLEAIATDNPVPLLPETQLTRLSDTWYDQYAMPGTAAYNGAYVATAQSNISTGDEQPDVLPPAGIVRGQVTGTRIKVLTNPGMNTGATELKTTVYYDEKGRALQTHSTNHVGGSDVSTVVYSFTGKPLSALSVHTTPNQWGAGPATIAVATRSTYHNDFLLKTEKRIDEGGWKRINQFEYDIMGKPVKKWMGDAVAAGVGTGGPGFYVNMTYNIRGWLTGLNKADQEALESAPSSTAFYSAIFSEVISYDHGFSAPQLNGNIAGTRWAAAGDRQARAYGYGYDRLNRLAKADFTQQSPTSGGQGGGTVWDVSAGIDYSVSNLSYDANGNILSMTQQGWKVGSGATAGNPIDQLTYGYFANSNRLRGVTDMANDNASKMGDFKYDASTKTATDYGYDDNGNLTLDNNKKISDIRYNHLNLPQLITVTGNPATGGAGGTVAYTYDAAGNKLRKTVTDNTASPARVTVTDYMGGFVYENNLLQYMGHEEGRARWAKKYHTSGLGQTVDSAWAWQWDYFYKDHLGSVRSTVTEQRDTARYQATFEAGQRERETALFANINETAFAISNINKPGLDGSCPTCILAETGTSYPGDNTTVPNGYTSRLNGLGKRIGAAITLKVMAGDKVDIGTKAWYPQSAVAGNWENMEPEDVLNSLLATLTGQAAGLSGGKATPQQLWGDGPLKDGLQSFLDGHPESAANPEEPRAYLNWVLLDEQFRYVPGGSGFIRVPGYSDEIQTLAQQGLPIAKSGYLFVYLSNETEKRDVFFDNLTVQHYTGPLVEETSYYPFGLEMKGIGSKAVNRLENRLGYNGKELQDKEFIDNSGLEWVDYGARMHDVQIGRWFAIDPKAEEYRRWSPYVYGVDNPARFIDPDGMGIFDAGKGSGTDAWQGLKPLMAEADASAEYNNWLKHGGGSFSLSVAAMMYGASQEGQSGDPDFEAIKVKYGVAPYLWHDDLLGKNSAFTVINVFMKLGSKTGLSSFDLYTLAIGEGLNLWLQNVDDENSPVSGFGFLGVDHFYDEAQGLRNNGFLPRDYDDGDEYSLSVQFNEKNQAVRSVMFKNLESALTGFSAVANQRLSLALRHGTGLGYGTPTEDQKMFWAYVFFQTPSKNGIGYNFLKNGGSWDYTQIKFDTVSPNPNNHIPSLALRRLATSRFVEIKYNRLMNIVK